MNMTIKVDVDTNQLDTIISTAIHLYCVLPAIQMFLTFNMKRHIMIDDHLHLHLSYCCRSGKLPLIVSTVATNGHSPGVLTLTMVNKLLTFHCRLH